MNIQETSAKAFLDMTTLSHTDIWFKDGNIVLIAGSFAFKVHSGQLERHSEMFAGMLDVPQPTVQDVLDECPVVEMHDSPDDLYHFLIALYDGLQVPFPRPVMFAHLAAVLRISTKYIVSHLRHQCLARLKSDWPSTLEGWDARENQASSPRGCYSPRQYTAHPILVIELAIEFGLNEILPSAFYDLSRYGPSKIMYGTPGIGSVLSSPGIEPRPVCLSNQLLVRTLQGRELAQNYLINFLSLHLETRQPSSGCWYRNSSPPSKAHPCAQAFQQMYIDIFRCIGGVSIGRDADPLFTLSQGMDRLTRPDKSEGERAKTLICGSCKVELLSDCTKGREAAWALIPEWFGLVEESKEVSNDENRVD